MTSMLAVILASMFAFSSAVVSRMWLFTNARFSLNLARAVPSSASGSTDYVNSASALWLAADMSCMPNAPTVPVKARRTAEPAISLPRKPIRVGMKDKGRLLQG